MIDTEDVDTKDAEEDHSGNGPCFKRRIPSSNLQQNDQIQKDKLEQILVKLR